MINPALQVVLLYSLLPMAAMMAGGVYAAFRAPGKPLRSAILHFAAGVVFSVVAVELLPDIVRQHSPLQIVLGFGLGIALMLGVRAGTRRLASKPAGVTSSEVNSTRLPWGLLLGIGVDIAIDGLLLGIGFAAGGKEGVLLAFALAIELLSLGLATSTELGQIKLPRGQILRVIGGLALLFVGSAAGGITALSGLADKPLEIVLSFSLAALLFLVTEELLVEAHEGEETPWLTATFFGGFLLFLVLSVAG